MADSNRKPCTTCGEVKPLDDFHPQPSAPDGRRWRCKVCTRAYYRAYAKARYDANPESERARSRGRYAADPSGPIERAAARARSHPEDVRRYTKNWRAANPEKRIAASYMRRALTSAAVAGDVDLRLLWVRQCGVCSLCSRPIDHALTWPDPLSKSVDHIVPLSKGGTHEQSNLAWTHLVCNLKKGAKAP
jgi:5-methylcytosine-specific restriction endonuclease McrA